MAAAASRQPSFLKPTQVEKVYVKHDAAGFPVLQIEKVSKRLIPLWVLAMIAAAVTWFLRRLMMLRCLAQKYIRKDLKKDIADFYDNRSAAWETVWGEHMHHGLYDVVDSKRMTGQPAQIRTMSELLKLGNAMNLNLPEDSEILDLGCGIGGASRFLARHFGEGCHVTGITLSPYQATRANELNKEKGLDTRVKNEVKDALNSGFPDEKFELIWSLESGEHIENKPLLMKECARMLKPGGRLVMLAWCVRESAPSLTLTERYSIRRIMEEYCLPRVSPPSEYETEMIRAGFRNVKVEDWTKRAAPFWGEVVRSAFFNPLGWKMLLKYKWPLVRSALAMRHVISGIRQGVFRLVAFSATKARAEDIEKEKAAVGTFRCRDENDDLP
ncbi:Methyltransferase [Gracilaria domingensis]|nr:Methyltransferase [Gracilaria domingensis]